jgi:hypothetical protein
MGNQESVSPKLSLPRIIALNGGIGSGKDTAATYLAHNYGYKMIGFSDPIYQSLYRLNPPIIIGHHRAVYLQTLVDEHGWDAAKRMYPAIRQMLRIEGTENGRDVHGPFCWVNALSKRTKQDEHPRWVIRDLRFPEEVEWVKSEGGVIWVIEGRQTPEVASLPSHVSESHRNAIPADKRLLNDGTLQTFYRRINDTIKGYL